MSAMVKGCGLPIHRCNIRTLKTTRRGRTPAHRCKMISLPFLTIRSEKPPGENFKCERDMTRFQLRLQRSTNIHRLHFISGYD